MPKYLVAFHPLVIEAKSLDHAKDIATFASVTPCYSGAREATSEEVDLHLSADHDKKAYDTAAKLAQCRRQVEEWLEQ